MSFPALRSRAFALLILLAATAVPAAAQHDEVQSLATRLAGEISKAGKKHVAVADFAGPGESFTELGKILSLDFTASLAWAGRGLVPSHSNALPLALGEIGPAPKTTDVFDDRVIKRLGQIASAEVVITGVLGVASDHVELSVRAADAATGASIAQATEKIPATPAVKDLLALRLYPTASPVGPAFHDGAYEPRRHGITDPVCIACPTPSYNDEARAAKISGTVMLRLVVLEDGSASRITVLRGLGHGLDEQAIRAVSAWRFKPATDATGKPVPVWTNIEVTFRLL